MNNRLIFVTVVILIVSLMLIINVNAIGISPGSTTIDFEPNKEYNISFSVLNNEKKDMKVLFNVDGELAQYVALRNILVDFKATEVSKQFSYIVKLPSNLDKPGTHIAKIIVLELPSKVEVEGAYIGARVGVISRLEVKVPYPGKYAEAEVRVSEVRPGQPAVFVIKVYNYGTEDIDKAEATIDILGPTNERVATIVSDAKSIKSKDIRELKAEWVAKNPGLYHAKMTLRYDGKIAKSEQNFYIGEIFIELLDISVKNFRLGGVAKFELTVENKWNDMLKNVFAEIEMRNQKGDVVGKFKSTSADIGALAKEVIIAYWDTENIESGQYDATIALNYGDGKKTESQFKADVSIDSIKFSLIGATAQVVGGGASIFSSPLVALLVVILIIINVGWFIYFRRRLKKK